MDLLIRTSRGSMRKALNLLWTLTRVALGEVDVEDVEDYVTTLEPTRVKSLLAKVAKAKGADRATGLRLYREVDKEIDALSARGMSGVEILDAFYDLVTTDESMPLPLQHRILSGIGQALHWASVAQDDVLAVKAFLRTPNTYIGGRFSIGAWDDIPEHGNSYGKNHTWMRYSHFRKTEV